VSDQDESVPDGTFGGNFRASTASGNLPPVTPEQAEHNRAVLEAAISKRSDRHGTE
jgi:hypothetical protein